MRRVHRLRPTNLQVHACPRQSEHARGHRRELQHLLLEGRRGRRYGSYRAHCNGLRARLEDRDRHQPGGAGTSPDEELVLLAVPRSVPDWLHFELGDRAGRQHGDPLAARVRLCGDRQRRDAISAADRSSGRDERRHGRARFSAASEAQGQHPARESRPSHGRALRRRQRTEGDCIPGTRPDPRRVRQDRHGANDAARAGGERRQEGLVFLSESRVVCGLLAVKGPRDCSRGPY